MRTMATRLAPAGTALLLVAHPALAQENKFDLKIETAGEYDSNVLRLGSQRFSGARDNFALSPRAALDFNRQFGRQRVFLSGSAGYVFNSRFKFLNRQQINFNGGANVRLGARCAFDPTASFFQGQSDLQDLGARIRNTVTFQDYAAVLDCKRSSGFYPKVSGAYSSTDNSGDRRERNQTVAGGRVGIVYSKPSLGGVEAFFEYTNIDRPNYIDVRGLAIGTHTDVTSAGVRYQRSVGGLIDLDLSVGYTHADPSLRTIRGFTGATFAGQVIYARSKRGSISLGFDRAVSARGNVGAAYYINTAVTAAIKREITARISASASIGYSSRRFRGEDNDLQAGRRGTDHILIAAAGVGYQVNKKLSFKLDGRYKRRDATNTLYNYDSKQATLVASLRL